MQKKYIAQIFTDGGVRNIPCNTITEARGLAEEYGTQALSCSILRVNMKGGTYKQVARHVRDTAGDGMRWFKA